MESKQNQFDSYWELYVAYINHCVQLNMALGVDPIHYDMEWNHWLPKASFPDILLGQWLTLKQHAIASALQTVALRTNCLCAWHKEYLPLGLLSISWPYYRKAAAERIRKNISEGTGAFSPEALRKKAEAGVEPGKEKARKKIGFHADCYFEDKEAWRRQGGITNRDNQLGMFNPENQEKVLEGCRLGGKTTGSENMKKVLKQRWQCTVTGYISTCAGLSNYQKARGIDRSNRIRIN
jgi:hypothetical protein